MSLTTKFTFCFSWGIRADLNRWCIIFDHQNNISVYPFVSLIYFWEKRLKALMYLSLYVENRIIQAECMEARQSFSHHLLLNRTISVVGSMREVKFSDLKIYFWRVRLIISNFKNIETTWYEIFNLFCLKIIFKLRDELSPFNLTYYQVLQENLTVSNSTNLVNNMFLYVLNCCLTCDFYFEHKMFCRNFVWAFISIIRVFLIIAYVSRSQNIIWNKSYLKCLWFCDRKR